MRVPAEERINRSFWLIDHDGERYFPKRIGRRQDQTIAFFRVAEKGNRTTDEVEIDTIEEVRELVVNHGYSVAAVPESDINKVRSLLKLGRQKFIDYGPRDVETLTDETF